MHRDVWVGEGPSRQDQRLCDLIDARNEKRKRILKLQGGHHAREARHQPDHLPGPEAVSRSAGCPAAHEAIVLAQSSRRVRRGTDIERGMADGGAQYVDGVERRDWFALNCHGLLELIARDIAVRPKCCCR